MDAITHASGAAAQRSAHEHPRLARRSPHWGGALAALILAAAQATLPAVAASSIVGDTMVETVIVNGGTDTANPGTTCVRITSAVSAACPSGVIAIQNNNKQLLAVALQAKATDSHVWFYYDDNAGSFHCPGWVYTPCSVISIAVK